MRLLKRCNDPIEHTSLGATTDTGRERMPVADTLGQTALFAAMRDHIQKSIAHVSIADGDLAPVDRMSACD